MIRMSLPAIRVLMTAVALAVMLLANGANKVGLVNRAATMAARGETAEARHLLEGLVTSSNPSALFVLACIELEELRFESASSLAQRLASVRPGAPEAVVLARLIISFGTSPTRSTTTSTCPGKRAGR